MHLYPEKKIFFAKSNEMKFIKFIKFLGVFNCHLSPESNPNLNFIAQYERWVQSGHFDTKFVQICEIGFSANFWDFWQGGKLAEGTAKPLVDLE